MITRKGIALSAMLLTMTLSTPLMAQRNATGRGGQRGAPPTQLNYGPAPSSQEELNAYLALGKEPNANSRLALSDGFLTTYPNSQLAGLIQRLRMDTLMRLNKPKEAIAAAEQGLAFETKFMEDLIAKADAQEAAAKDAKGKNVKVDKNAPPPPPPIDKNSDAFKKFANDTENDMMAYYQGLMSCYQQLNDAPKAIEWGEKAVMQKPDDLLTLLTLSSVMAARPPADPKELDKQMKQAEDYGKQALTQATALFASPIGAQITPAQKGDLLSQAHETLGRVYYNIKKLGDSQKEYGAAIAAKKDDGDAYYFLGLALVQDKPPKVEEGMDALAKCVFLKGATAAQATDILKQLYQNLHKSMDGFDDFVKTAGAKIGQ